MRARRPAPHVRTVASLSPRTRPALALLASALFALVGPFSFGCIGLLAAVAQPVVAQDPNAHANEGVGWISPKNEKLRAELAKLLLAVPTKDLAAGWQLAADLGQPAVPMLWDLMASERSNVGRRLAVLAAAALAGGTNEDERLFDYLAQPRPMLEERCLAMILVALGPRRTRPMPDFWSKSFGPAKSPERVMAIAVRLAAARFPGVAANAPSTLDTDPGVAAAAAFAGLPVANSVAAPLWNLKNPPRHAELFWRGALLGAGRTSDGNLEVLESLRLRAREVSTLPGIGFAPARAAATLLRSRLYDHRTEGARLEWDLLELAAADGQNARALRAWLQPTAPPRVEDPRRLAVSYVLSRSISEVVGERLLWSADPQLGVHVALALAWRALGENQLAPITVDVPSVPEWFFVQWASGAKVAAAPQLEDAHLGMAAVMAQAGRLPAAAARTMLEEGMWRLGSHPGLGLFDQERLLLRDLLLVGSHQGGGKYTPHIAPELRYRPPGMGPDHPFYEVAVALFDFLARARAPVLPGHELR